MIRDLESYSSQATLEGLLGVDLSRDANFFQKAVGLGHDLGTEVSNRGVVSTVGREAVNLFQAIDNKIIYIATGAIAGAILGGIIMKCERIPKEQLSSTKPLLL